MFLPKAITICSRKKERFNYKNNYRCSKLANFRVDNISKINCRMLVVLLYTLLELGSKKVQLVQKSLNSLLYCYAAGSKLPLMLASFLLDKP